MDISLKNSEAKLNFRNKQRKTKQNKNCLYHGCLLNLFWVKKERKCCCLSVQLDFIALGAVVLVTSVVMR